MSSGAPERSVSHRQISQVEWRVTEKLLENHHVICVGNARYSTTTGLRTFCAPKLSVQQTLAFLYAYLLKESIISIPITTPHTTSNPFLSEPLKSLQLSNFPLISSHRKPPLHLLLPHCFIYNLQIPSPLTFFPLPHPPSPLILWLW